VLFTARSDIIMVGEIRDGTAEIAVKAAQTHLVLSTLHTKRAANLKPRTNGHTAVQHCFSVNLIMAQRLGDGFANILPNFPTKSDRRGLNKSCAILKFCRWLIITNGYIWCLSSSDADKMHIDIKRGQYRSIAGALWRGLMTCAVRLKQSAHGHLEIDRITKE
jgi:hypothetical protein